MTDKIADPCRRNDVRTRMSPKMQIVQTYNHNHPHTGTEVVAQMYHIRMLKPQKDYPAHQVFFSDALLRKAEHRFRSVSRHQNP